MDTSGPFVRRLRSLNPLVVDAVLALALAAVTLIDVATSAAECGCVTMTDAWWSAGFLLTQTLPLALRRRSPFTVFAIVGVSAIVYDLLSIPPEPDTALFAVLVAVYSVSAYARRSLALAAAAITATAFVALNLTAIADPEDFASLANQIVLIGGAWVVGENARYRRRQGELLRERAVRTEREQRERERTAALEERGRLAREIHDVVAHSVSVIAVQAGAARAVAEQRPDRAREALGAIEDVSKQTMTELRRALGALRAPGDGGGLSPAPGVRQLDELAEQVREAGIDVRVRIGGDQRELPSGVDLSAYRIVQEALTNTIKHAGPTTARVDVRYRHGWLELTVTDDGPSRGRRPGDGDGRAPGLGLVGIRERVTILGGTLEAGPKGHGFEVRARLPLDPAASVR